MNNINELVTNVKSSRKRTAVIYCSESFMPIIAQFRENIPEIKILDCTDLYKGSLTFSASDLLNQIELVSEDKPTIIFNIEALIVPNLIHFEDQLAKLLSMREPLKPLFFLFYSKKIFCHFRDLFESKELNCQNTLEL
jgi:hypothetical protein